MNTSENMETLSGKMNAMRKKGYVNNFEIAKNGIELKENNKVYKPEDLTIQLTFRFEGDSNPGDMSVLYAIESNDNQKGLLIDAFGTYANNEKEIVAEMIKKMKIIKDH